MMVSHLLGSPAKAGAQSHYKLARGSVDFGAMRRVWTPVFAGEQGVIA